MNFSRGEENLLEDQIKSLKMAGIDVVVSGGKFGDLALHYMNKYDMMAVRLQSKFDVRRVAKTTNAVALPKLVVIIFLRIILCLSFPRFSFAFCGNRIAVSCYRTFVTTTH